MTGNKAKLVLKITFVMSVLNFSLWSYIKEWTGVGVWYTGNALAYVGYLYVIYEYTRIAYKQNKRLGDLITWSEIALGAAISNVIDELFFDPTKIDAIEYLGFTIIILIALYNDRKRKRQVG